MVKMVRMQCCVGVVDVTIVWILFSLMKCGVGVVDVTIVWIILSS